MSQSNKKCTSTEPAPGNVPQSAPSSTWHVPGEHPHYAYPGIDPSMETILRMAAVKRWHMIATNRTQSLAEHTANVALLGWHIALTSPGMYFEPASLAIAGLMHDLEEVYTGDMPTPTKLAIGKDVFDQFANSVLPAPLKVGKTRRTSLLLKVCDLVDGIRFVRLHGTDASAEHARRGVEQQLLERLREADAEWPVVVVDHVIKKVLMYAYEESLQTRNLIAPMGQSPALQVLANDVARRSGDFARGAGSGVRDERGPV